VAPDALQQQHRDHRHHHNCLLDPQIGSASASNGKENGSFWKGNERWRGRENNSFVNGNNMVAGNDYHFQRGIGSLGIGLHIDLMTVMNENVRVGQPDLMQPHQVCNLTLVWKLVKEYEVEAQ
jgi:hypothetical protein